MANLLRYLKTASSTNDDAVNGYSIGSVDNDGRGSSSCGISNTCSARKRHYCKQSQQLWYYVLEHQVIHKLQLRWGRSSKKVSIMTVAAIFTARAVVAVAAIVGTVTAAVEVGSPVVPVAVVAAASSGLHQYTKVGD